MVQCCRVCFLSTEVCAAVVGDAVRVEDRPLIADILEQLYQVVRQSTDEKLREPSQEVDLTGDAA